MFGWIPLCLGLPLFMPLRHAILAGYLVGWLFLPQAGYPIGGLPDYTRMTAVNAGMLLCILLKDPKGLFTIRPRIWDLPMLVWCLCPLPTSLTNGLGAYDGFSGVLEVLLTWGVPYWIGRAYFSNWQSMRLLAIVVFVGGLIYMPLCLWETRMSPQLHRTLYGFHATPFHTVWRLGGYRPMMFLQHGIAVGLWMCTTAVTGFWLWRSGSVRRVMNVSMTWLAPSLMITAVLCRSMNALALSVLGLGALLAARLLRVRLALLALFLLPALYVTLRASRLWYPDSLVRIAERIDPERSKSLQGRLKQEEVLLDKAWRRPLFGWGSWGRNRMYDDVGESVTATDSQWIIVFGQQGLVGLISLGLCFAVPAILLWWRLKLDDWWSPRAAPAAVLAVCLTMYACDRLMNAMPNPIYHVMMGAVLSVALHAASVQRAARAHHPRHVRAGLALAGSHREGVIAG
jgi:hypothetical protein